MYYFANFEKFLNAKLPYKNKWLIKNKITLGKNLFHSFSIIVRIKRFLRILLGYDYEVIEKIENMSNAETKNFSSISR